MNLETCTVPLAQHCRDAMAALSPAGPNEHDEATSNVLDCNDWALQPRKKLQKVLSMLSTSNSATLLGSLDVPS